jgi:hypothetical protein
MFEFWRQHRVFRRNVGHIVQLGFLEFVLLVQPVFGIGLAWVSRVAPLLAAGIDLGVASRQPVQSVALFPAKAFLRRPHLNQPPIDAKGSFETRLYQSPIANARSKNSRASVLSTAIGHSWHRAR